MLYNRLFSVSVGRAGSEGLAFTDIRANFRVTRTIKPEANDITADFYNLSQSTRSKFEDTQNRVILQAGYVSTGLKLLAIGDITRASSRIEPPVAVTVIEAKDGGRALREARASVSYEAGVAAEQIINDLVERLDIDDVEISADLSGVFRSGWSFVGRVSDGLDKLAGRFNFEWSIQNNTVQITDRRQPTMREAVFLSPATGLIGSPTRVDDVRGDIDGDKEEPGVGIRCLLNPAIMPGDPVVMESREYPRATYRAIKVEHTGDTHGDQWTTYIEAAEAEQ